jgi:hypothetical protein
MAAYDQGVESEPINWSEQLALLGFFYPEPEYHPEAAAAASLRMEQPTLTYKNMKDELRAEATRAVADRPSSDPIVPMA